MMGFWGFALAFFAATGFARPNLAFTTTVYSIATYSVTYPAITPTPTPAPHPNPGPSGDSILYATTSHVGAVVNAFQDEDLLSVILLRPGQCQPLRGNKVQWTWKKDLFRGVRIYKGTEAACDCSGKSDLLLLGNIQHQVPRDYWCIMLS